MSTYHLPDTSDSSWLTSIPQKSKPRRYREVSPYPQTLTGRLSSTGFEPSISPSNTTENILAFLGYCNLFDIDPLPYYNSTTFQQSARSSGDFLMSRKSARSTTPLTSPKMSTRSPQAAHSRAMQRVISQGSNGTGSSPATDRKTRGHAPPAFETIKTVPPHLPSSPASGSGGVSTPKASQARLPGGKKDEQLAQDLEELQVRSPVAPGGPTFSMSGTTAFGLEPTTTPDEMEVEESILQGVENGNGAQRKHRRTESGSTDSSSSGFPSQLGSMYGVEGFTTAPTHVSPYGTNIPQSDSPEYGVAIHPSSALLATTSATDELIKQLNGTSTVYRGVSVPGPQQPNPPTTDPFKMPPHASNFVRPQNPGDKEPISRQSSTSSSTTEASTSSEESDLCIPELEWSNNKSTTSNSNWGDGLFTPSANGEIGTPLSYRHPGYKPFSSSTPSSIVGVGYGGGNQPAQPQSQPQPQARMLPPPTIRRTTSPRTKNISSPTSHSTPPASTTPLHPPSGLKHSSALPSGMPAEAMDEDADDDDQTIGQRDKSPGASIHSSESGFDMLARAAQEIEKMPSEQLDLAPANSETKGKSKRKARTETVDEWRNSGIPTGTESEDQNKPTKGKAGKGKGKGKLDIPDTQPTKKRRRSSAFSDNKELIDPELLDDESTLQVGGPSSSRAQPNTYAEARTPYNDVAEEDEVMNELDEDVEEEEEEEEESEPDGGASEGDSEYGGTGAAVTRGRGGKGKRTATSTTVVAKTKAAAGGGTRKGTGRGRSSLAGSSKATPAGGSGGKKGKKTTSPGGGGRGGGRKAPAAASSSSAVTGGVQCEYTNPLPVSFSCLLILSRDNHLLILLSHTTDVKMFSLGNMIYQDIWLVMLDEKEN